MEKKPKTHKKDLNRFGAGIQALDEVYKTISHQDLDRKRARGKWTIRQIIHHIADAEILWSSVIKSALGNPGCTFDFSWYILDNKWADPLMYDQREVEAAIELFRFHRKQTLELLSLFPDPWAYRIVIRHDNLPEKEQEFPILQAVQWQTQHLDRHIAQIKETLI